MKRLKTILTTVFLSCIFCLTAFASNKVTNVSISIAETKTEPGTVYEAEVRSNNSYYEIEECIPSKDYGDWKPGSKITYNITIVPKEGYSFDTKKIKKVSVSNGEVASDTIKSSKITLKVNYIPKVTLAEPENIYFEDEYLAVWDKVEYCKQYEVQVLKENDDGKFVNHKTVKVDKPEIDLSSYATDGYEVTFKVRAIAKDSNQSVYLKSSQWVDCNEQVYSGDNTSYGNFSNSSNGITFKDENGNYATGWQQINGSWYYFNPSNNNKAISSSWALIEGKWFLFNEYGIMQTGWVNVNSYWYYLNPVSDGTRGAMVTGWMQSGPSGPWYYLQQGTNGPLPEGAMYANMNTPDGFFVDGNGEWR